MGGGGGELARFGLEDGEREREREREEDEEEAEEEEGNKQTKRKRKQQQQQQHVVAGKSQVSSTSRGSLILPDDVNFTRLKKKYIYIKCFYKLDGIEKFKNNNGNE